MILMKREQYYNGMLKYATFHVITGSFCKEIKFFRLFGIPIRNSTTAVADNQFSKVLQYFFDSL